MEADTPSDQQAVHILVLGGSQGAKALNERLPAVFADILARHPNVSVLHQTGRDRDEPVRSAYAEHNVATLCSA